MEASWKKMPGTDFPVKPLAKSQFSDTATPGHRSPGSQHSAGPSRSAGPASASFYQTSHWVSHPGQASLFSFLCSAPNALEYMDGRFTKALNTQRSLLSLPITITGETKEKDPNLRVEIMFLRKHYHPHLRFFKNVLIMRYCFYLLSQYQ